MNVIRRITGKHSNSDFEELKSLLSWMKIGPIKIGFSPLRDLFITLYRYVHVTQVENFVHTQNGVA